MVIILCCVCYSKYIKKDKIIWINNYGFLIVLTQSMEPAISEKEFIVINNKVNYEVGDVVTYLDFDNMLITHRIIEISQHEIITKGDNNDIIDLGINKNKVQGKVIYHSKMIGVFILDYLKILILIYAILICIVFIKDICKGDQNDKDKKER